MGLFNRKKIPVSDFSPMNMKETMKALGLVPGDGARSMFGWTEEDDKDGIKVSIEKKKRLLSERISSGCSLREEMQIEIEIDGQNNHLNELG